MVNIIIPLFKGRNFIRTPLNSLLRQTYKDFIITIVHDYDQENYDDIIDEYKDKLNIDYINCTKNIYQGPARQKGIDAHPECDYVMFLDQDDEYTVEAIEVLYQKAKETNADIVISSYFIEANQELVISENTHMRIEALHGKIYSLSFLTNNNIRFKDELQHSEDTYFNLLSFSHMPSVQFLPQYTTYLWKNNPNSQTQLDKQNYLLSTSVDLVFIYIDIITQFLSMPQPNIQLLTNFIEDFIRVLCISYETHYHFQRFDLINIYTPIVHNFFMCPPIYNILSQKRQWLINQPNDIIVFRNHAAEPFNRIFTTSGIIDIILNYNKEKK